MGLKRLLEAFYPIRGKLFTSAVAIFDYAELILRVKQVIKNHNRILYQSRLSLSLKRRINVFKAIE